MRKLRLGKICLIQKSQAPARHVDKPDIQPHKLTAVKGAYSFRTGAKLSLWVLHISGLSYFQPGVSFLILRCEWAVVAQSCPILCNTKDWSLPGSSVHGILQSRTTGMSRYFPSPENLPDPGIELRSPALQAGSLPSEPPGKKALHIIHFTFIRTLLDWAFWFSSYMDELGLSKIQYFT